MSTRKRVQSLGAQHASLLARLLDTSAMVKGTFQQVYQRCGKPTCRCVDGQGHLSIRISWTENAKSRTKAIPIADVEWVKSMTSNYKKFRKTRQRIRELNDELNRLLDELEREILNKTKRQRKYLQR